MINFPPPSIVTIVERIPLKPAFWSSEGALVAGQAYDVTVGDNAHDADGHVGHAAFFIETTTEGCSLVLIYPWLDRAGALRLLETETGLLDDWFATYAAAPRHISFLDELPVDVGEDA